ncbi:MAG: hypothetical protein HYZ13_14105 [Acidobacteria bacterium]|nr:hypothetical protein [Acidobacteriota bacterium]
MRVSELLSQRMAEKLNEDPSLLAEIPFPSAVRLAASKGLLTNRQEQALIDFNDTRQTLIELCWRLKGDTPISVIEKVWSLVAAGEQVAKII